jgi:hypothetical protein
MSIRPADWKRRVPVALPPNVSFLTNLHNTISNPPPYPYASPSQPAFKPSPANPASRRSPLSSYRFTIDAANPNLPHRLIQPILLFSNSTYSMSFNSRKTTRVGSISVVGSVQAGTGAFVQLAGGSVTGTLTYAASVAIGNLVVRAGGVAVAGVVVLEVSYSGALGES